METYGAAHHRAAYLALAWSDASKRCARQQPRRRATTLLRRCFPVAFYLPVALARGSKQRRLHALRKYLHETAERLVGTRARTRAEVWV